MTDLSLNARTPIRRADLARGNRPGRPARTGSLAEGLRRRGLAEVPDQFRRTEGPAPRRRPADGAAPGETPKQGPTPKRPRGLQGDRRPTDPPAGASFPDAPAGVGPASGRGALAAQTAAVTDDAAGRTPRPGSGSSRLAARLNAEGPIRSTLTARDRAAARVERIAIATETPERERPDRRVPDRPADRPGRAGSAAVPPSTAPGASAPATSGPALGARVRSGAAHFRRRGTEDTTAAHRVAPAHLARSRGGDEDGGDPTVSSLYNVGATAVAAAAAPAIEPDGGEDQGRHLEVVPPRRRSPVDQRKRNRVLLGLSAVAAAFVVFSLVYLHVISTEEQFRIDKLANQETQQEQIYQDYRLQANRAASPASIYNKATKDYGMTEPTSVQAVQAPRGSATPASSDLTPSNGATAPSGVSDWPAVENETGGGS